MGDRAALRVFAWSRAGIWAAAVACYLALGSRLPPARGPTPGGAGYPLDLWANWDGGWFTAIAHHSYGANAGTAAFFPLYPGLLAVAGRLLLGRYVLAGVVLSLAACAVAFVLVHRLAELELGRDGARRAVVCLAVFPLSFFLQAVYSESLFLALAAGAFLAARRGRWRLAGLVTAAAFLTRPTALALLAGLLVLAWRAPERRRAIVPLALSPLAFVVFPLVLWWQVGDPWAFLHAERHWHRALSPAGPFGGAWEGLVAAVHGVGELGRQGVPAGWDYPAYLSPHGVAVVNLAALGWLLLFVALAVLVWRRHGAAYGVFAALSLALPLSAPWSVLPLLSLPRFGLVVFPFFFVLARLGRTPARHALLVGTSVLLLVVEVARFALWRWVA